MDSAEALSALGLTRPTSSEAVRRAYLRAVRAHSPERDPVGFRRVRDAYELLKDAPWRFAAVEHRVFAAAVVSANDVDEPIKGEHEDESEHEARGEDLSSVFSRQLAVLHSTLSSGDFEGAAQVLLEAMGDRRVADDAPFRGWHVLEAVLGLIADGKFELGGRLFEEFEAWTIRRGMRARELGLETAARLTLAREIRALDEHVDDDLLKALARAVKAEDFSLALPALARASRRERGFEETFRAFAPSLHAATWPLLAGDAEFARRVRKPSGWGYLGIVFIVLQAVRVCGPALWDSEPTKPRSPLQVAEATNPLPVPGRPDPARAIDEAVQAGDCARARDIWPLYALLAAGPSDPKSLRVRDQRRAAVLAMCPELEGALP